MPVSSRTAADRNRPYWRSECGRAAIYVDDCREVLPRMEPEQFHAVCTDPPYHLVQGKMHSPNSRDKGFMGYRWDGGGVAFEPATWEAVLRVARPGAHMLSFGGTRAFHRMVCAIEDAGFEVRDMVMWVYASGYPKGLDISKGIDAALGATREVVGTRTMPDTTKVRAGFIGPAHSGNSAGAMREVELTVPATDLAKYWDGWNTTLKPAWEPIVLSRKPLTGGVVQNVMEHGCGGINVGACRVGPNGLWPANVAHDGSNETLRRYFYGAKASADPEGNRPHGSGAVMHPTVKPLDLMRYLVRLVCAPGGTVLDPFLGSGSTLVAAVLEGMRGVGIEQSREYADIAVGRIKLALAARGGADSTPPPPRRLRGAT